MKQKMNFKPMIFLIAVAIICFITGRFIFGIIIFIFLMNYLKIKNTNKEKNRNETGINYRQPSASKTVQKMQYHEKSEEQKQREKWEKRRNKDPWEWDE